jgi:type I restriction enzyme S subunit
MSNPNFEYVPLTFITDQGEIKKQIRNTLILFYLVEKYHNPVRLETMIVGTQYGYNASALKSGINKFLRISDINESKVNWETVPYCNCDEEETYILKNDDILIARTGGTTGKSFKIDNPPANSVYAGYLIRIRAKQNINPDYIYLFLHSFAYWSQIVNLNERNFRPKANAENLKALILPDCPKIIQDDAVKISKGEPVQGYEDLYRKVDKIVHEYENTQEVQKLFTNQLSLLSTLNQAILQEAVQGKLVKQDPVEEPAGELLKRIKAEKAALQKAQGKGKSEKPLPPVRPEEIPFEIPGSWVWCRLGEIVRITGGGTPSMMNADYWNGEFLWVSPKDMKNEFISDTEMKLTQKGIDESSANLIPAGSILVVGRSGILKRKLPVAINLVQCTVNQDMKVLIPFLSEMNRYLQMMLFGIEFIILSRFVKFGMTVHSLKYDEFSQMPIPLPPLSEQRRIVAEIERQMAKTRALKEHIEASREATGQLLKALLHEAFEVGVDGGCKKDNR